MQLFMQQEIFGPDSRYVHFDEELKKKVEEFSFYAEKMPGVVMIHEVGEFPVVYMSSNGLRLLGLSLKELQELGTEYYNRYFNQEDSNDLIPKILKLLGEKNPDDSFTFIQQVKLKDRDEWVWHISCTRIFAFDKHGEPKLVVTVSVPIDRMKHMEAKAERLLKENMFLKKNLKNFLSLGGREKEVLKLVALGKSSKEIADELFVSQETVNTHRKNIKRKLNISSNYDFVEYAHSFDLI